MSLEENTIPFEVLSQGTLAALDTALAELQASQLSLPRGAQQCVEAPQRLACTPQAQCPAPAPCQPPLEVFCEAVSPHEFLVFGCGLQAARARLEAARLPFFDAAHSAPGSAPALRLHLGHYESALGVLAAAQLLRSPRPGVPRSCIPHSTLCTLGALARAAQPGTREYLAQVRDRAHACGGAPAATHARASPPVCPVGAQRSGRRPLRPTASALARAPASLPAGGRHASAVSRGARVAC